MALKVLVGQSKWKCARKSEKSQRTRSSKNETTFLFVDSEPITLRFLGSYSPWFMNESPFLEFTEIHGISRRFSKWFSLMAYRFFHKQFFTTSFLFLKLGFGALKSPSPSKWRHFLFLFWIATIKRFRLDCWVEWLVTPYNQFLQYANELIRVLYSRNHERGCQVQTPSKPEENSGCCG